MLWQQREFLDSHLPSAARIVAETSQHPAHWRSTARTALKISVGRGEQQSQIDAHGAVPRSMPMSQEEIALASLVARISRVSDVPVQLRLAVDSHPSHIGVWGPEPLTSAYARSLVIQILRVLAPHRYGIGVSQPGGEWAWLTELPHPILSPEALPRLVERFDIRIEPITPGRTEQPVVISIARSRGHLPGELDAVVSLGVAFGETLGNTTGGASVLIVQDGIREPELAIAVEVVSREQATVWARGLRSLAEREGFVPQQGQRLLDAVALSAVLDRTAERDRDDSLDSPVSRGRGSPASLACSFLVGRGGDVSIDLVADGPHAIVGGTTGSGKSELLISWVIAIAARYRPAEVNFLLIDYKGGASFGGLTGLPHCVGIVTDLDAATATRALESLAAELRFREQALAEASAKSITDQAEVHGLARLVIVVDEFAAMASEHPELHALFSDIAARGRSLGVHLILCTQRPAGVIREAVFANSALRISLRVNNRADSVAVVGDGSAALLPASQLGRASISRGGEPSQLVQCALAAEADIARCEQPRNTPPLRRPWLEPLGENVALESLLEDSAEQAMGASTSSATSSATSNATFSETSSATPKVPISLVFGRLDYPERQEQPLAVYQPRLHGHLLMLGDSSSGKSTALSTIAQSATNHFGLEAVRVAPGVEALWDTVTRELERVRAPQSCGPRLVLIDDLDAALARAGIDHERELTERLCQLLREGPSAGLHCVITMRRVTGLTSSTAQLMGERMLLAHASRQEFILAGGDGQLFRPRVSPGWAQWHEHIAQVATPSARPQTNDVMNAGTSLVTEFATDGSFAVVTADPVRTAALLRERFSLRGSEHEIVELGPARNPGDANLTVSVGQRPRVILGSPETWQSFWGALESVAAQWPVVIEGCSVSEYRSLTKSRTLPPPLANPKELWWLLRPTLEVARARFAAEAPDA